MRPAWRRRIEHWRTRLPQLFYQPLGAIDWAMHADVRQYSFAEAQQLPLTPVKPGHQWGAMWEYGWFRGEFTLPEGFDGKMIALAINTGGESAVLIDGVYSGAIDREHKEIILEQPVAGHRYVVWVETYAGDGARILTCGPVPDGKLSIPETETCQVAVGKSTYGVFHEVLFQLWMDLETLLEFCEHTPNRDTLRVERIEEALKQMTLVVDLELPLAEVLKSAEAGRTVLTPVLQSKNGTDAPALSAFGHSHIDLAWLWPKQETVRKCARTFGTQLGLMRQYPEYRYLQSQPWLYEVAKTQYPELYKRVKLAVENGQWLPEGGMYVEADTNLTGGESLIRQFMYGKRFLREEFGIESELLWLPDVFGYTAALPQIMKGCGITAFSTQKLLWTYNGGPSFPYNFFHWQGLDGSRVLSYIHNDYNSLCNPSAVIKRWQERLQKEAWHSERLFPFGHGDGGGGPTRRHLEFLRRQEDFQDLPKCKIEHPNDFFARHRNDVLPVWSGELYFQGHRGTYTSQSKTKRGNRRCEFLLRELEMWCALAGVNPGPERDECWKELLFLQFHDILTGSSVNRVYQEAEASYQKIADKAQRQIDVALTSLVTPDAAALTVFNSLGHERNGLIELPPEFDAGNPAVQHYQGKRYSLVTAIPACGSVTLRNAPLTVPGELRAAGNELENSWHRLRFNERGEIISWLDKINDKELLTAPGNRLRMYKDIPATYDAWDIDENYTLQEVAVDGEAELRPVASGPYFAVLRLKRQLLRSTLEQEIVMYAHTPRIDFRTRVDWRESHKLLKVDFPTAIHADEALHEIQFGHIRRPNHRSQPYDAERFEVCQHKWSALFENNRGVALLNDCKYGIGADGGRLHLTLLKSPLAPDGFADKGIQEFTYSLLYCDQSFADSQVVNEAYDLNAPLQTLPGARRTASLLAADNPQVIIECVKPAEDGRGIIMRCYESAGCTGKTRINFGFAVKAAVLTDMLENNRETIKIEENGIVLEFSPFQIITIRMEV